MKLGIVFEGGASRTYFSCGVMTALVNNDIKADIITGSSAGIAYAVSYASWQPERAVEILKKYYSKMMQRTAWLSSRALFQLSHRRKTESSLGIMTKSFINAEMKSNVFPSV